MTTLLQDLSFAIRQLRKNPGFALLAILTLALGIGANAAMFTVIDSVLLRPVPYRDAGRLVDISASADGARVSTSWLNYRDVRDQAKQMQDVAGYSDDLAVVETGAGAQSVFAPRVTSNLFSMLGAQPVLGRVFTSGDGEAGAPAVVILSNGLWRQSFGGDPQIIGKQVRIGKAPQTVIGVMPASFAFPENETGMSKGIWLPLQPTPEMLKDRGYHFFYIIGKLKPGVTLASAQQELAAIAKRIEQADPEEGKGTAFSIRSYRETLTASVRPVFFALTGALVLVLLIACANVANLQLARYLARKQEFAVRAALGANRLRLMRQLISEGALLSLIGAGCGLLLAWFFLKAIGKLPEGVIPRGSEIHLQWGIVGVLFGVAAVCTILSSLIPALWAARTDPQPALQAASRGVGTKGANSRLSSWLVAGEVALSVVLLVGSGLMFHTLWNLEHAHLGFETLGITTFTAMPADAAGFSNMAVSTDVAHAPVSVAVSVYAPALEKLRQLPGVVNAALATAPPLFDADLASSFDVVGKAKAPRGQNNTRVNAISAGYANVIGAPVLQGRMISENDGPGAPFVAVINESFAKKYFPEHDALNHQIDLGGKDTGMLQPYTIVGVLADASQHGASVAVRPEIYLAFEQVPTTSLFYQALLKTFVNFVVKTRGAVDAAPVTAIRNVFHQTAPGYALDNFRTMQEAVDQSNFNQRLALYLTGSFTALAILMVLAGLYGVLAQLVGHRQREIGVRMALGASRGSILAMVLRQGAMLIAIGLLAGFALAFASGRLVRSFLYNVSPVDVWTYIGVAIALLLAGCIASWLPARHAASVDPMQALRME
ncbi:MAG: ABC transporter permease [Acidobacteriaceae bacterium]